ncbi:bifunctional phosphoribosylaminoimidazolecarboxamide formyltransferase/IMP cyclohydrolase [Terrihabitans rhizophilus]|uniref:Bifunctional purine biosynthesis protein PurH n=1 Tax=Terrihabitans rhizophilus TaxID=3092662 RepID=A0ABU4RMJ8_9HYPH|nr:bifunctional phosphoribosylaminoimidazolecarboxamide formyltransferase/IMP cyclohydrolase [Terrihabitans sp. PJ23]MDX6806046.1 bifunctional phosphoribosylaminoimidazolecarboxamide formyltransferase/IMP cyclohydrolase [Terrihabitans sp. PJ23]
MDRPIRRALLSVSDKTGLVEFARALAERGVELVSTGGTAAALKSAGLAVRDVSELTGFPEMMDGRVKTLHPSVHGGLLAIRGNAEHDASAQEHGIVPIDLLLVNLYPFEQALARGAGHDEMVENVDVGGPAMIRGAAKNYADVTAIVDPTDYPFVLRAMDENGGATTLSLREALAAKAFARTSAYDAAIASYMARHVGESSLSWGALSGSMKQVLRYGENPHQTGSLWATGDSRPGVVGARQVGGKELSYNNINDTDAAYELVAEFDPARSPACVIVKHANPCGVAEGADLADAYRRALACDPVSAFGGIIAVNGTLTAEAAAEMVKIFTEVIIAPDATEEAIRIINGKKNLRLLLAGAVPDPRIGTLTVKTVTGGLIMQSRDNAVVDDAELKVVTKRQPTESEMADLLFGYRVVKHVKSNAIVYARGLATVGIGAGQMSRVDASVVAVRKAAEIAAAAGLPESLVRGSVVASDAFFPFADGLIAAADAGATAAIQPGGSVRDQEVIEAADARGMAMVFTGVRHFRH